MNAPPDREQLRRHCSGALEVLLREQRTDGLAELAEALRVLGHPYRFHGELMHGALRDGQDNAITWHLIQVLAKLEQETLKAGAPRGASGADR